MSNNPSFQVPPSEATASTTTLQSRISRFNRTDAGNAELFAAMYKDDLRYDHKRKRWLIWKEHRWIEDDAENIIQLAKQVARWRHAKATEDPDQYKWAYTSEMCSKIEAMVKLAESEYPLSDDGKDWDSNPWLLGVANGVVDLRTGQLRKGLRSDKITLATGVVYDAAAKCPRFEKFLSEIFGGDEELIRFIQRSIGYSTTGATTEQVLFLCYGTGANGKTTLFNVIRQVLGDYAHDLPFATFELKSRSDIPHDIAGLVGRRFATARETSESVQLNEARIKTLTGSDPTSARFLYKGFFTFVPVAKIWLAFNHKPEVADDSEGFWRRVRLMPFEQNFSANPDRDLEAKLMREGSGILNWAIRGCLEWQNKGLGIPKRVSEASQAYREESDPLRGFCEEKCILAGNATASAHELWTSYLAWTSENKERPLDRRLFSNKLKDRGLVIRRVGHDRTWTWVGIGLRRSTPERVQVRADADVKMPLLIN